MVGMADIQMGLVHINTWYCLYKEGMNTTMLSTTVKGIPHYDTNVSLASQNMKHRSLLVYLVSEVSLNVHIGVPLRASG